MRKAIILTAVAVFALAAQGWAGHSTGGYIDDGLAKPPNHVNANVKFALHLAQHSTTGCGKLLPTISSRNDIVSRWNTSGVDLNVYVVVFDYDSLSVVEYGLNWPVDWATGSTVVCDANALSVGKITNSGDGMAMAWSSQNCILHSVKPYFLPGSTWLAPTSNGTIEIMDYTASGNNGVVDCRSERYEYPDTVFYAHVGMDSVAWFGPPPHATEPSTWGSVKAMFK